MISNARMYAVTEEAEKAWERLIARVSEEAGVSFTYQRYDAPQPLECLWRRSDIGCVQMCGYPIVLKVAEVVPLAAPIPAAHWAGGEAIYRSDLIVRSDTPFRDLTDTFSGTLGWTVAHSHSGFNALRHHLLAYRTAERPRVYNRSIGNLITARMVLDSVLDGTIDIRPLDAYWHMLINKYDPELTEGVRVLHSTATAPMPAFVASPKLPVETVERVKLAFSQANTKSWFEEFKEALLIDGFAPVTLKTFETTMEWDRAAQAADYPEPA